MKGELMIFLSYKNDYNLLILFIALIYVVDISFFVEFHDVILK